MAIAGTTTMAVEIAQAVATARLLHQFLLGSFQGVLWITSLINILLFPVGNVAIYNPEAVLITYGLSAATNVILTSLTGTVLSYIASLQSVIIFAKLVGYCGSGVMHRGLESGAIFSISSIFLLITFVGHHEMYVIGTAFALRLLNIIPTFTLVYVGLNNIIDPDHEYGSHASSDPPNTPRMRTREGRHQSEVLDIKLQGEMNDGQSE
ncbi:hypothetical protein B0H14DRAFT_2604471 [Mycena olivaceomarginata]|nr:hypothetical protein B0H14DRAFT_2604471 [Mycena olivaceomarginata]